jgi:2-amino-4-hydroxy-6-hydroxymethyldihydropteridine diphosphokinase
MAPAPTFIALGANLGNREANLRRALDALCDTSGITIHRVSSFLENPAVGGPSGSPAFINAVAQLETTLEPHELLHRLLDIERTLGRVRREKWEPRLIDLDLLAMGDHVIETDELVLPHPRLHERRFVLQPLAEIAPDAVHPRLQRTFADLLEQLEKREQAQ